MEIVNDTLFAVEMLPMKGPACETFLIIIVKGTFDIRPDESVEVSSEQFPVAFGDEFYDDKEGGSARFESDIVPFKTRADIVLVGKAYAPDGSPVTTLDVVLRVGDLRKTIRVIGDRHWVCEEGLMRRGRFLNVSASEPEPFNKMEITYERAFGGMGSKGGWCEENLIGRGFFDKKENLSLNSE